MVLKKKIGAGIISILMMLSCASDDDSGSTSDTNGINIVQISTFGGSKNDSANSITSTSDGGYAILGYTQSMDLDITDKQDESYDFLVLKYDAAHNPQWSKTFGGSGDDRGSKIIQTSDGGFAILGYSTSADSDVSANAGLKDYWLVKLDASGNMIWDQSFGYSGLDTGISLIQTFDNGFMLVGELDVTASNGEGNSRNATARHAGGDYWALKLDANGQLEWRKYFGGYFTDTPADVIQTSDNGFIIIGTSDSEDVDISNNKGTYDIWVIKIDEAGTLMWNKNYGGSEIEQASAIVASGDGNYLIAGETRSIDQDVSVNHGAADLWVIKMSPNGDLIWEKTFGGTSFDVSRSIRRTTDNGFLISGSSRSSDGDVSTNQGQNDAWLLKIDANANLLWQTTIGGSDVDFAYDATELADGAIILVGESSSSDGDIEINKGFLDVLMVKLNQL